MNKIHKKRLKRKRKIENKKKVDEFLKKNAYRLILRKLRGKKPKKVKKEIGPMKPYKVILLQRKVEKVEAGIRALDHNNPEREKLAKRLKEIKNKLNGIRG